jgi:predicted methyltransferase
LIEGFFPATAMPDRDWWATLWPDPAGVLRALGIRPGMVVVDLCCGDGYFTAPLAKIVDGQVHAVDIDPAMIEQTRAAVEAAGTSALSLLCADARDLPALLPGHADCVLIANTFHGVPGKTAMACTAAAVLRPGGRLAIVNWRPLPREHTVVLGKPRGPKSEMRMSPDDVRAVVEPGGFVLEQVVDLPPFHYGAMFGRTTAKQHGGER